MAEVSSCDGHGKPKIFTIWPFAEKVGCHLKYSTCLVQFPSPLLPSLSALLIGAMYSRGVCLFIRNSFFFFKFINFFWLRWVFVAARGLSLVAASWGCSLLWCAGFSLRWLLLLRNTGSRRAGFSSYAGSRAQAQ